MKIYHIAQGMPEFDRAAVDLGHDIRRVNWPAMFGRLPADYAAANLCALVVKECEEFRPDLVFIQAQQPGVVNGELCDYLRSLGAFVVNWTGDVRDPIPAHYINLAPHVNVTAFTNLPDVVALHDMGHDARFLQIGYDPDIYHNNGTGKREGVVFIGNDYGYRFPLSQHRRDAVNALKKVFGHSFTGYGKGFGKSLNNGVDADVYRRALVAVNLDHFNRSGFHSDRYLRSTACGAYTINGTALSSSALVDMVREALADPKRTAELGALQAAETYNIERWHNRINTVTRWATK
jgi:hypothetical protein